MITYTKLLILCMFSLLYKEAPTIEHSQKKIHIQHREDVQALGEYFSETGSRGKLVNEYIDPTILAAMSFEESRYRRHGRDGDPRVVGGYLSCTRPGPCNISLKPKSVGQSIGPMQISRMAPSWVKTWEEMDPQIGRPWAGLTLKKLRDPATNVAFAYALLEKYKRDCGGPPAVWIDSYGRGKCSPRRNGKYWVGKKAIRRCRHVDNFVKKIAEQDPEFIVPENWSCRTWKSPTK